jgi:hypothetical protein
MCQCLDIEKLKHGNYSSVKFDPLLYNCGGYFDAGIDLAKQTPESQQKCIHQVRWVKWFAIMLSMICYVQTLMDK